MAIQTYRPQPVAEPLPPGSGGKGSREPEEDSWAADLMYYVGVLRRRWWLVLLPGLFAAAVVWWQQRDYVERYTAEALIQRSEGSPLLSENMLGGSQGEFGTQVEVIRSRAVLAPVVDSLALRFRLTEERGLRSDLFSAIAVGPDASRGMYILVASEDGLILRNVQTGQVVSTQDSAGHVSGPGFRLAVADTSGVDQPIQFFIRGEQGTLESLRAGIRIEQGKGRDLLWVRYSHADPELAAAVVNAVAHSYRRYRAERAREAAAQRRRVIADQLVHLSDSLEQVQRRVLDYQSQMDVANPSVESSALIQAQLQAEGELRDLRFQQQLLEGLVTQLNSGNVTDGTLEQLAAAGDLVPSAPGLVNRLRELRNERSRLTAGRFGYTENQPDVQVVDSLMNSTKSSLKAAAEASLEYLGSRISTARNRVAGLRSEAGAVPERVAQHGRLEERVQAVREAYDRLVEQYYQAQVAEGVEQGDVTVVDPAVVPLSPDPNRERLKLLIALMAGLMIGAVGAVTFDQLDLRVRDALDAEEATQVEVIGTVPTIALQSQENIRARIGKESFRAIRTNLRFLPSETPGVLTVTSAEPGEGKSMVAANLALTFVEQGARVLLIDADLRRSQVHRLFGAELTPGLSEVLRGEAPREVAIRTHQKYAGFDFIPAGKAVETASELLGGEGFLGLLEELKDRYDHILIDTPPVLTFTDATVAAVVSEGTLVVARANKTDREALEATVERLRRVNVNIVGIVLNDMPLKQNRYYEYYDKYYGERREEEEVVRPLLEASS